MVEIDIVLEKVLQAISKGSYDYAAELALSQSRIEIVKSLINLGAVINLKSYHRLRDAVINRKYEVMEFLLESGSDPLERSGSSFRFAAKTGDLKMFEILMRFVDKSSKAYHSMLNMALKVSYENSNANIMGFLLQLGADISCKNYHVVR